MRMLGAAGVPLLYTQPESFEHEAFARSLNGDADLSWIRDGYALKWLAPLLHGWPPAHFTYRAIILTRDPQEQARSQRQFLETLAGIRMTRAEVRALAVGLRRDNDRCGKALSRALPGTAQLTLTFESLIEYPTMAAQDIASFVGLPAQAPMMAAQIKRRAAACHPGLMELELLEDPTLWHGRVT